MKYALTLALLAAPGLANAAATIQCYLYANNGILPLAPTEIGNTTIYRGSYAKYNVEIVADSSSYVLRVEMPGKDNEVQTAGPLSLIPKGQQRELMYFPRAMASIRCTAL